MKFLLDHDVPAEVGHLLRHWGHEATLLGDALPVTASDEEIFLHAQREGLMLISCNRDHFLAQAQKAAEGQGLFPGLIILIRRRSRQAECAHLLRLLRRAGESGLIGNINFA